MKYTGNISADELQRIERFLTGEMPEEEAAAFKAELTTNADLELKTSELRMLLLGINESVLKDRLPLYHTAVPTPHAGRHIFPMAKKWLVAASIALLAVVAIWFFVSKSDSSKSLYSRYYQPDPGLPTVMSSTGDYAFEKAMVEYKNHEYDKALQGWNTLLKTRSENDTLRYFIGAAYLAKNDDQQAIKYLGSSAADTSSGFYGEANWYLGLIYLKQGEKLKAAEFIKNSNHTNREAVLKAIHQQ
ncbi:MAG: hypothetical protein H7Y31_02985 [Chitinophagaceae bacterium]|nr:hypothetical protein [Chitinophagaceae bacterium]